MNEGEGAGNGEGEGGSESAGLGATEFLQQAVRDRNDLDWIFTDSRTDDD